MIEGGIFVPMEDTYFQGLGTIPPEPISDFISAALAIDGAEFSAWFNARENPKYKALVFDSFGLAEMKKKPEASLTQNSNSEASPNIDSNGDA